MYALAIRPWVSAMLIGAVALMSTLPVLAQQNNDRDDSKGRPQQNRDNSVLDTASLRWLLNEAMKIYATEKATNAEAEKQRDDREREDLAAQKDMAFWALCMFMAAAAQIAVGVITLGFLWGTFREAKRTADAGIEAALAATRSARAAIAIELPILTVTHPPHLVDAAAPRQEWEGAPGIDVFAAGQRPVFSALLVSNHGRTPAIITKVSTGFYVTDVALPEVPIYRASHEYKGGHVLSEGVEHHQIGAPGGVELDGDTIDCVNAGTTTLYQYVLFEFEDFLRGMRHAGFCYRWTKTSRNQFYFVPVNDVPPSYIQKPQDS